MKALAAAAYAMLSAGAEIIEADAHGPKVMLRPDGTYLKLFRRKRLFSSALWNPYAQRFTDNAAALHARDIPCPRVIAVFRQREMARDIVHYRPLPGRTVRQIIASGLDDGTAETLRGRVRMFVDGLHAQGIYFRSAHLGNIVLTPDEMLGLIDIADLKMQRGALTKQQRQRNFAHILRYPADRAWLLAGASWADLAP